MSQSKKSSWSLHFRYVKLTLNFEMMSFCNIFKVSFVLTGYYSEHRQSLRRKSKVNRKISSLSVES